MNQYSADFMVNKTDIVHVLMEYTFSWGYLFLEYRYMILMESGAVSMTGSSIFYRKPFVLSLRE